LQNGFKGKEMPQKGSKGLNASAVKVSEEEMDEMDRSGVMENDRTVKKIKK
jgi:hypothetical protein